MRKPLIDPHAVVKAYLAAPLFSQAERAWNRARARARERRMDNLLVDLPQDLVALIPQGEKFAQEAFEECVGKITRCDVLVAVLDGAMADDGTCFEAGLAKGYGKPVIGVRTDFRDGELDGCNIMLGLGCDKMLRRTKQDEDVKALVEPLVAEIKRLTGSH